MKRWLAPSALAGLMLFFVRPLRTAMASFRWFQRWEACLIERLNAPTLRSARGSDNQRRARRSRCRDSLALCSVGFSQAPCGHGLVGFVLGSLYGR